MLPFYLFEPSRIHSGSVSSIGLLFHHPSAVNDFCFFRQCRPIHWFPYFVFDHSLMFFFNGFYPLISILCVHGLLIRHHSQFICIFEASTDTRSNTCYLISWIFLWKTLKKNSTLLRRWKSKNI